MSDKLPALHFYPGDWWKDSGVQTLDHFHKGIWFELLLMMFDSSERGKLLLNGKPYSSKALAKRLAVEEQQLISCINELCDSGVCHRDDQGTLFNKRMVRDEEIRQNKIKAGSEGGRAKASKQNPSSDTSRSLAAPEDEDAIEDEIENEDIKNKEALKAISATAQGALLKFVPKTPWPPTINQEDPLAKWLPDAYAQFDPTNPEECLGTGRRPLKKYPEIWIGAHELAACFESYEGKIPAHEWKLVFRKVQTFARNHIQGGQKPQRINCASALMGWAKKEVISELNEEVKLKRNSEARV